MRWSQFATSDRYSAPNGLPSYRTRRALEQELLHALVDCLTAGDAKGNLKTRRQHADIMVRFEDALTAHSGPQLNMPAVCAAIGVPERTLRVCCTEFLGVSPSRYCCCDD